MGILDWLSRNRGSPKPDSTPKLKDSTGTAIGNPGPVCPYCNYRFDKIPQRKKKCPNCAKFVYSRTRPLDNEKVLLKEDQIEELEKQWTNQTESGTLRFNLVNSHAVALGKIYKESLIKRGGSDITEVGEDEIARRVFNPWLAGVAPSDRERIANVITSAIETGKPLKAVSKELKTIPAMSKHDTDLIAQRETKAIFHKATMDRFNDEGIQQGIWHHMSPQENPRPDHEERNGQTFDIDDPIWNEMMLPGCKCWCEPVTRTAVYLGRDETDF